MMEKELEKAKKMGRKYAKALRKLLEAAVGTKVFVFTAEGDLEFDVLEKFEEVYMVGSNRFGEEHVVSVVETRDTVKFYVW